MKKFTILLFLSVLCFSFHLYANNTIDILSVEQRPNDSGIVDIEFNLNATSGTRYDLTLEVTFDGVEFSMIPLVAMGGDLRRLAPGTGYQITWNGMLSHPDIYSEGAVIRMTANLVGSFMSDLDGNTYRTTIIGQQEWMAENLRVTSYRNGNPILTGLSDEKWPEMTEGAYTLQNHELLTEFSSDQEVLEAFGALYNGYAVNDERGLCPTGWRMPEEDDLLELIDYIIEDGTYFNYNPDNISMALRSCLSNSETPMGTECVTTTHPFWFYDDTSGIYGRDDYGFSALAAGHVLPGSGPIEIDLGFSGWWWLAVDETIGEPGGAINFFVFEYNTGGIIPVSATFEAGDGSIEQLPLNYGLSVRCMRDL